ncbi:hypothetical protein GKO32_18770 [Amycolatopsis sp. RM579]|uniref:Uncharacterized protein n=2 Tax=Amycolatopsis pithecellobii TaxID=664692 RepID=A0A6N7YSK0_9PSEU|nr:hypothetical protein [Amycolatopsis pithecellobii]
MVVGQVNGREQAVGVANPADALAHMLEWFGLDRDAVAFWYLRADWPSPVTLIGRPVAGLVGETRRCVHLFPARPGTALFDTVTACCGTELSLTEIEWVRLGAGMPCEPCLVGGAPRGHALEG